MASSRRIEAVINLSPQALTPERRPAVVQKLTTEVLAGRIDAARLSKLPPAIKREILIQAKEILDNRPAESALPKSGAFNALYDLAAQLRESSASPRKTKNRQLAIARRTQAALSPDLIGPFLTTGDNQPLTEALIRVPRPGRPRVFSTIAAMALTEFGAGRIDGEQLAGTVKGLVALDDTAAVDPKTGRRRRALSLTSGIMTQFETDGDAMAAVIPRLDTKTLIALNCPGLEYCTPQQVAEIIGDMAHFIHPPDDLEPTDDGLIPKFYQPVLGIFAINQERLDDSFSQRLGRLTTLVASVLDRADTAAILQEGPKNREAEELFPSLVVGELLDGWRLGRKMPHAVKVLIDLAVYGSNQPTAEFLTQHPDTDQALLEAAAVRNLSSFEPLDPLEEE